MIFIEKFLQSVQKNIERIHSYELGHDGSDGKCDCIGLIIGALRMAGIKWPWTHGSNYTARNKVDNFRHVSSASELRLGELVFKAREPGDENYALPSSYDDHPDRRDYYHVGVVTSVNPLEITHCTSVAGGIKHDSTLGQWRWAGELALVDYDDEDEDEFQAEDALYQAAVYAENGYPVKMRKQPSTGAGVCAKIPIGTVVDVLDELDGWALIGLDGQIGYMMRDFLRPVSDGAPGIDGETVLISRSNLLAMKALLVPFIQDAQKLLEEVESALSGGEE